jgi:hypothetical protein
MDNEERKRIAGLVNSYKKGETNIANNAGLPEIENQTFAKETDPDLITSYEIVKLPSQGMFYKNGISEVNVEYMTSKDEDLITTPSLIENNTVIDLLLKRKIKTSGIQVENLLEGDRNAIILFLRISSYGNEYTVMVNDPRTGIPFKTTVDLLALKYKEINEYPDELGHYTVMLPMRKKEVKIRLLTSGEDNYLLKQAQAVQEVYGEEFSSYNTMRLKASIVYIGGNEDRTYIDRFVDAMPALDAYTIRKKILEVSPNVDMKYQFTTKDGYKFYATLEVGTDFFFPQN